ncbi:MAG TPA: hypothetical protein VJL58_11570 [Pyrinomonadaceae bacterium]|nr:hypothetical protein [Pyrinomonadaceae bacterium]
MKRKITLSIMLALSIVLVSLTRSDSTAKAQPPQRFFADTGFITPGPDQRLRLTISINPRDGTFTGTLVSFTKFVYAQPTCDDGICTVTAASQNTSEPIRLMPGEAVWIDIYAPFDQGGGVRGVVQSNDQNVQVNALIIDIATDEVVSFTTTYPNLGSGNL